jgi:6-phosphogluconolactonase
MRSSALASTGLLWFSLGTVAIFACNGDGAGRSTSAAEAAGGAGKSAAGGTGGALGAGDALAGAASGGRLDSGMTGTGASGGGTAPPKGTPVVMVGSTDGVLRAFTMDDADGSLSPAGSVDGPDGLDFIALGPDDRTVFATRDSAISAYVYDPTSQSFSPRGDGSTAGRGTHVAIDPSGRYVFVAHYDQGVVSLLPFSSAAGFGASTSISPGVKAHQVRIDASGRHVYVPCLGSNHVAEYDFDPAVGTLSPASTPTAPAGGGPRHMDFSPSAPRAYVLAELSSQLHVYDVDSKTGLLSLRAADSVYTSADGQYHWSSDVHVTPDGRHVYATNRQPSEVVRFAVLEGGGLERLGAEPLEGVVRSFAMDPRGRYLQIGGDTGSLVAYRIDPATGGLTRTASTTGLGNVRATIIRYMGE